MVRFPEAEARLLKGKFVCKRCKQVQRAPNMKVIAGKITCRSCGNHRFKPKRKK